VPILCTKGLAGGKWRRQGAGVWGRLRKFVTLFVIDTYLFHDIIPIEVILTPIVTKQEYVKARLNENGRIVIPAAMRKQMGLKTGDAVLMTLEDGVLRIESHRARIRKIQEEFKQFARPGVLVSDELVADRREEARQEMEEWLG
jgi:AbrB family looped-hinge helix DNA binding protein